MNRNMIIYGIILTLAVFCFNQNTEGATAEIRVHSYAKITSHTICLRDFADIQTENQELQDRLAAMIIAESSNDSEERVIGIFEIQKALAQAQISLYGIDIFGSTQCRLEMQRKAEPEESIASEEKAPVRFDTAELDMPEESSLIESQLPHPEIAEAEVAYSLSELLAETVAEMAGLKKEQLKIEWQCTDPDLLALPAGGDRFKIVPQSTIRLGNVQFTVTDRSLQDSEDKYSSYKGRYRVQGKVEFMCESVVATELLKPGQVITQDMVKVIPRRVTSFREVGISDLQYVLGQEVARTIAENELVLPAMIRKLQLVNRNDYVDVVAKVGMVEIRLKGKALGSGAYGDMIMVRDETNKTNVQGRVTGKNEVTVVEDPVSEKAELLSKDFIGSGCRNEFQEN